MFLWTQLIPLVPIPGWVVVSNIFYFHPYLGKWSNLTNIFQMGWNHQPAGWITFITVTSWNFPRCNKSSLLKRIVLRLRGFMAMKVITRVAPAKTDKCPLKNDGWKTIWSIWILKWSLFRGLLSNFGGVYRLFIVGILYYSAWWKFVGTIIRPLFESHFVGCFSTCWLSHPFFGLVH